MSRNAILVALGGLVAVAAIIAAVVFTRDDSSHSTASSSDRVSIEIRSNPIATISIDGKQTGTTPMRLQFPKSSRQVAIKAEMVVEKVGPAGTKRQIYSDTHTITLDSDQTVDFTRAKATLDRVEDPND